MLTKLVFSLTILAVASCTPKGDPTGKVGLDPVFVHYTLRYLCQENELPVSPQDYLAVIPEEEFTKDAMADFEEWLKASKFELIQPLVLHISNEVGANNAIGSSETTVSCDDLEIITIKEGDCVADIETCDTRVIPNG